MNNNPNTVSYEKIQKTRFTISLTISVLIVAIIWIIKFFETSLDLSFSSYGILPRSISGLKGVFFAPFLHGSFKHLFSNTFPLLILTTALLYFYPKNGLVILPILFFVPGVIVWIIGRDAFHLGASIVIYGLAAFIFFAGLLSRKKEYLAVALIVVFLYGSLVWGLFPNGDTQISWEGHLSGFIVGTLLSLFFYEKPASTAYLSKISSTVDFIYKYDHIFTNSTQKSKFFYNFENKKTNENYYINYETDYFKSNTDFAGFFDDSTTSVF